LHSGAVGKHFGDALRELGRVFSWKIALGETIANGTLRKGGGLVFEGFDGRPILSMTEPSARDAKRAPIALSTTWDRSRGTLQIQIAETAAALAYPVVVDPRFETSTWVTSTQRTPSPRYASAAAFDSVRQEVVAFGGYDNADIRQNDTWVWSSAARTWSRRAPATAPTARAHHAMAFDAARNEIILFGGDSAGFVRHNDTWVWNGATSTWTQRTPALSPSPRSSALMVFDSSRGLVVLFGGETDTDRLNDAWVWNGTTASWESARSIERTRHAAPKPSVPA